MRPRVTLSFAMTEDGFLDDNSPERLVNISSPEDYAYRDILRCHHDAIMVGANTIRKDSPRCVILDEELRSKNKNPLKVTLTKSGDLDPDNTFFTYNTTETHVYSSKNLSGFPDHVSVHVGDWNLEKVFDDLGQRGVESVLVEGGGEIISQILSRELFDILRICLAPFSLGGKGGTKAFSDISLNPVGGHSRWPLQSVETFGDCQVFTYCKSSRTGHETYMQMAVLEREKCPPADGNFQVGCVICSDRGEVLVTGHTGEIGDRDHAEQVAISKAKNAGIDLTGARLYCTLEPCGERSSYHTCCADLIAQAGISDVYYLEDEPGDLVDIPMGRKKLKIANINVTKMDL